jgi:hypothetical protein
MITAPVPRVTGEPAATDESPSRTLVVAGDVSRWGEAMVPSAEKVWTKVSGKDTAEAWSAFESIVPAGPECADALSSRGRGVVFGP